MEEMSPEELKKAILAILNSIKDLASAMKDMNKMLSEINGQQAQIFQVMKIAVDGVLENMKKMRKEDAP